jgi:hypothetical protein
MLPRTLVACQIRHCESGWHFLFRYIRYNGLRRPDVKLEDGTPAALADGNFPTPQNATRLGMVDSETTEIVCQDDAVDTTEST